MRFPFPAEQGFPFGDTVIAADTRRICISLLFGGGLYEIKDILRWEIVCGLSFPIAAITENQRYLIIFQGSCSTGKVWKWEQLILTGGVEIQSVLKAFQKHWHIGYHSNFHLAFPLPNL